MRTAKKILNIVWYSIAIFIVLAAVLVALGREMMPHVRLNNKALSHYISERINGDFSITDLRGQWVDVFPEFTAHSIDINLPQMDVHIENLRMEIDVWRSLLNRSLVFDRLHVNKASIVYLQDDNSAPADIEKTWRTVYLLLNKNIRLTNVDIVLKHGDHKNHFQVEDFRVARESSNKKVYLRLTNKQDHLTAIGTIKGENFVTSQGNLYFSTSGWPLQKWLPETTNLPPAFQPWRDTAWHAKGQAWVDWQGINRINSFIDLSVTNLQEQTTVSNPTTVSVPDGIHTKLSVNWQKNGKKTLDLYALQVQKQAQTINALENVHVEIEKNQSIRIQTPQLLLDPATTLATFLPRNKLYDLITSLHPKGSLRNVDLLWDNSKPLAERMKLRANADAISTGNWHGVPAFTQAHGYLDSGIGYGFIDLESRDGFSMFYPDVYHSPMFYKQASGRVQWNWLPEEKTVFVGSDYLSLSGEDGEARGNFWLRLPIGDADFTSELYMAIGLQKSNARYRDKYLPYTLPQDLLDWLKNSISVGELSEAGFIYRGNLSGSAEFSRAIQFYTNIEKGDVLFDPQWPRLTNLQAKILVDDGDTTIQANTGKLLNTVIKNLLVRVIPENPGILINVNSQAQGPASDGLRILRDTPLRKTLGDTFDSWKIERGEINTTLQLQIPLAQSKKPQTEDVRIRLKDTQLLLQNERLQFDRINGELTYQTQRGLNAQKLQTMLFASPATIDIRSEKTSKNLTMFIHANGEVEIPALAHWSRLKPLQMLSGDLNYQALMTLGPLGKNVSQPIATLSVQSDLQGVSVPLPYPLAKSTNETKPMDLQVDVYRNNTQNYQFRYDGESSGAFRVEKGSLIGGEILIFDKAMSTPKSAARQPIKKAELPSEPGHLQIRGVLSTGDLADWLSAVNDYNKLPEDKNSELVNPVFSFTFEQAKWGKLQLPHLALNIAHDQKSWRVEFNSIQAQGSIYIHDDKSITDVVFSILKLENNNSATSASEATESKAPSSNKTFLDDISFEDVPSLNLSIDHFFYNTLDIGSIRLQLRSSPQILKLQNILITGPGYNVRGNDATTKNTSQNKGAQMQWVRTPNGKNTSEFHGLLHMRGDQPAVRQLGIDPFVVGKNIYISADLSWPGSPLNVKAASLAGIINTRGEKGEYLQASTTAAMRLINVFNIATWARRLRLDFSDLTNKGIAFDSYKGELTFDNGIMSFSDPLRVKSPSSSMVMSGKVFLVPEKLDLNLTATLPVGNNATWIAALAGGLPAAAGVYLVSKVFSSQLDNLTSLTYNITGPMSGPNVSFSKIATPQSAGKK